MLDLTRIFWGDLALAIDYAQHFGPYDGKIVDDTGRSHTIRNAFGALERMRARF